MPQTTINLAAPRIPGWRIVRPLSDGAQAHTYVVAPESRPGDECAVAKVMRLQGIEGYALSADVQRWRMEREVRALTTLRAAGCEGVVRVLDHGSRTEGTAQPWMIMHRHAGPARSFDGSGFVYAERFRGRVTRVMAMTEALARTLSAMHEHPARIVHRDLHLGNVLMDGVGSAPVLGDFGIAHVHGHPPRPGVDDAVFSGAWHWRPPEVSAGAEAGPASDIFMLGGVVFEALSGGFVLSPADEWGGACIHARPEHHLGRWTTDWRIPMVNALLDRMLAPDPAARLEAAQVVERCREIRLAGTLRGRPVLATA
ncbi:MAG TPA: protein kinase [Longimicrobium sp.]|jgi:serine/threonine protein kinase|uniref:protein kinase domain-containing protein n=1 Tax=Longimicrobium sp. TaxID=2029185 RepID=UPI002ED84A13